MYNPNPLPGSGRGGPRRFDEYYRCYPTVMLAGAERPHLNYGGKLILPPSALDKLSRLHITYPMLFELRNGPGGNTTHAGVLEFVAEEGKCYLPGWMMKTLGVSTGDLLQILSTNLPSATLVKLQPQSPAFLDISDPKAVLENAFRNFSTLTKGDVFSFSYNDEIYDVAVLEVKPENSKNGVSMIETDVEVDFAPPVGYVEPDYKAMKGSGASTPGSHYSGGKGNGLVGQSGMMHTQGTMAQAINYDAIAPSGASAADGAKAVSSHFAVGGQKVGAKKGAKPVTPKASTPVAGKSTNQPAAIIRRTNGPQPLRLGPNKLFFGYEIKPVKTDADRERERSQMMQPHFEGQGQTLRGGKGKAKEESKPEVKQEKKPEVGRRLDGKKAT